MATQIICRRFAGRSCRSAAFSTTTKAGGQKTFFGKREEGRRTTKADKGSKPAILWKPPEYRVTFDPSAYAAAKGVDHEGVSRGLEEESHESNHGRINLKQTPNSYSIASSQRLDTGENQLSTQAPLMKPDKLLSVQADGHAASVEAYDTKEDPRTFQKLRPEYRSLCYNTYEGSLLISAEEMEPILQKVTVLKSNLTPGTIVDYFSKLSYLPAEQHRRLMSSDGFAMLCHYGVRHIKLFDVSEIITLLKAFVRLAIPPTHVMMNVYAMECCFRAQEMSLNQQLLVADLWRCLGRNISQFLETMLRYVNSHWQDLTLAQLVQLVYIIGESRKVPEELLQKLDFLVNKHLDFLNLEEVGAICLGFFKSKGSLSECTMQKIGDKVSGHLADMSNYALVNILKMFRLTHIAHSNFLTELGSVVPAQIPTMGIQGVMHIALACSALHYFDERIMNAVASSVPSRAAFCRSKDIAKFLWSFGCLNYEPPNAEEFYASLEKQIYTKMHEFQNFPEHLLTCLLALAFAQRFPHDLIDYALSPEFIAISSRNNFQLEKDFFTLDGTVEIECPDYTGNRLAPQLKQEVTEMLWNFAKKSICTKPEVSEAMSLLEDMLGGPQFIKTHMILPHTRSIDLEIHLDPDLQPVPFNSEAEGTASLELNKSGIALTTDLMSQLLKGKSSGQSPVSDCESKTETCIQEKAAAVQEQSLPTSNHFAFSSGLPLTDTILDALLKSEAARESPAPGGGMKLAVQLSSRNHYCYGSKRLLGLHNLKRRQLRQIGYRVVELPFWEWFPLLKSGHSEKLSYLRSKVFGSLGEEEANASCRTKLLKPAC
ncbi:FAST kinase domain-containing protein 5, mitochondrial [Varanus komodoensis]|uniref:FAST kinase domain-containing protein 5, mitochondrial n=1 Tax=Varanus komodoensis TaxID=61221 RepID=UPI001CF7C336|nr:FAST kinase domain-containing protein 5, mitochondrial [Varanus komodoensis]XP_044284274.1 FAST kinase domain-containing protein 5, mitochondrial [Varanus komodoensis]